MGSQVAEGPGEGALWALWSMRSEHMGKLSGMGSIAWLVTLKHLDVDAELPGQGFLSL